jgi:hypothetical protein
MCPYLLRRDLPLILRLQDDLQLIMRTVSSPNLLDKATNIDPVLATDGWQTLLTITRESARKLIFRSCLPF